MTLRMTWLIAAAALSMGLQGCGPPTANASVPVEENAVLARGTVDVEGGLLAAAALRNGRIVSVEASLGQEVSKGAVLAQLADGPERAEVDIARAEIQRARATLASARSKRSLLQDQIRRVREAVTLGAESGRVLDELELQLASEDVAIPAAEAAEKEAEARLSASVMAADAGVIRSPAGGRVVQVNAHVGALATSTDTTPLFLLRPHGPLIVRVSLAARDVPRVRPGMKVSVQETGSTRGDFTGRVREVGELARKPDSALPADDFASERVVDCIVELDVSPLRIGDLVLVRFGA